MAVQVLAPDVPRERVFGPALLLGLAGVVVVLLVGGYLSYRSVVQMHEDARWVAHTHEVLDAVADLRARSNEAVVAQRGYLLTGEESFFKSFNDVGAEVEAEVAHVGALIEDNPLQNAHISRLSSLAARLQAALSENAAIRRSRGVADVAPLVAGGNVAGRQKEFEALLADIEAEETRLLADRRAANDRAYRTATATSLAGALAGLAAVGIFARLVDRTQRARQRAAARVERVRAVLEATLVSIGDGVITTDARGRVTFLNGVAEELTGWTTAEAAGRPLDEVFRIINEQTRKGVENPAARALREGKIVGLANHTVLIARDGGERPLDDSAAPIKDRAGRVGGAVLVFRDVAERRRAERALRESEERLRLAQDVAHVGTFEWNIRSGENRWTPELERMYGLRPGEFGGTQPSWERLVHPEDRAEAVRRVGEALDRGSFEGEWRVVWPDGTVRWLAGRGRVFKDEAGEPVRLLGVNIDVTERKRAEEARLDALRLKQVITDNATTAIVMQDPTGRCTFMNPAAERVTGFTFAELKGKNVHDAIHHTRPDGRPYPMSECDVGKAVTSLRPIRQHEDVFVRKDGTFFPVVCNASPVLQRGTLAETVLEFRDVTQERRAADALRESEGRLRLFIEHAPAAIAVFDREMRYLAVSHRWLSDYGLEGRELVGRSHYEVFPEVPERWRQVHRRGLAGEILRADEDPFERADGSVQWVRWEVRPWRTAGGGVGGIIILAEDVTARKVAETDLRERERQLRLVTDNAPVLIAHCDIEARYKFVNRPYAEQFGLRPEDVVGMRIPDVAGEEAYERFRATVEGVLAGKPAEFEADIPHPGGTRFMRVAYTPERDAAGRVVGLVAAITDITSRRDAEQQLRVSEARYRQLAAELDEANRRKDEFLATLGHELRNPLAPISSGLQIIGLAGPLPERVLRVRAMMERQVAHMVRLVDDLLEVGRITRGRIELQTERVDLRQVVRQAVETSGPLIEAGRHRLSVEAPAEPVEVEGDAVRLTQVISNLLNNAAKFTADEGEIHVTVERADGRGVVRVRDNGPGIPATMLGKVFDLFTQVNRAHESPSGGLGIGLALVKRLVEMHGGTVEARSDGPGSGSEFVVRLPLAESEEASSTPTPDDAIRGVRPLRVLVVDDNVDAAQTLMMVLEAGGHDARAAHDGAAAVEVARSFRPEVVLLDLGMPVMDGYQAASRLRDLPELRGVKVFALTGWGQDEDRRRTREAGFDGHLVKPVDAEALDQLLGSVAAS